MPQLFSTHFPPIVREAHRVREAARGQDLDIRRCSLVTFDWSLRFSAEQFGRNSRSPERDSDQDVYTCQTILPNEDRDSREKTLPGQIKRLLINGFFLFDKVLMNYRLTSLADKARNLKHNGGRLIAGALVR
jgi:hypothetical protein